VFFLCAIKVAEMQGKLAQLSRTSARDIWILTALLIEDVGLIFSLTDPKQNANTL